MAKNLSFGHFSEKFFFLSLISQTISLLTMFWRWLEINFLIYGTTHRVLYLSLSEIGVTWRQGRESAFEPFWESAKKKYSPREGFEHTISTLRIRRYTIPPSRQACFYMLDNFLWIPPTNRIIGHQVLINQLEVVGGCLAETDFIFQTIFSYVSTWPDRTMYDFHDSTDTLKFCKINVALIH